MSSNDASQTPVGVAALVCGVAGLATFLCFLGLPLAVIAVVCGIIGRMQAKQHGLGTAMPTAGLVLGALTLTLSIPIGFASG
jgi:hypothetical protein